MGDTAIKVEGVSKKYVIGALKGGSIRDTLEAAKNKVGVGVKTKEFWALKDVSFEVKKGQVMGVVGKNGAGKSTLLKIMSRITHPTEGRITVYGQLSALLEVGTGFHPELTGRENIFLNGAILGMKRAEIKRKFDEILDFSGVEEFIDTPVKRYSSGMYVRLAFAVAAHLEPEIMIIDEVLAVGDAAFQKKCLGKMRENADGGRTVVFVSHSISTVMSLCDLAIYLSKGRLMMLGTPQQTLSAYMSEGTGSQANQTIFEADNPMAGDEIARAISIRLIDEAGNLVESRDISQPVYIETVYRVNKSGYNPLPALYFYTQTGETVFSAFSPPMDARTPGEYKSILTIPADLMNTGGYFCALKLETYAPRLRHAAVNDVLYIEMTEEIEKRNTEWAAPIVGVVRPKLDWKLEKIS